MALMLNVSKWSFYRLWEGYKVSHVKWTESDCYYARI